MNWNNVDLNSGYEKSQNFLDGYDFDTLLLEVYCNMKKEDTTRENILKHVKAEIANRVQSANEIILANIDNIVKYAIEEKNRE